MMLRPYQPSDLKELATIYRDAVFGIGITAYSPEQAAVWASFPDDEEAFAGLLSQGIALIADVEGHAAAFCHLHPGNHISLLYTATRHARQGLATAVYLGIETHARQHGEHLLTTDASKLSRPFFEHHGFVVRRAEQTIRKGVSFERFQMEKKLVNSPSPAS